MSDEKFPIVDQKIESTDAKDEDVAILSAVLYILATIIMLIIVVRHTIKYYQDLFTEERKSVKLPNVVLKYADKPERTPLYKLYNTMVLIAIYLYLFSSISGVLNHASTSNEECTTAIRAIICFLQAGKTCKHLVWIMAIFRVYQKTKFIRANWLIITLTIIAILYGIFMIVLTLTVIEEEVVIFGTYPNWCKVKDEGAYAITAGVMILKDLIVFFVTGFIFYSVFMRPLLEISTQIANKDKPEIAKAILAYGSRISRLVFSTLFLSLVLLILTATISGIFSIPLPIINSMSVIFLTNYYSIDYYKLLCCCCIKFIPDIKLPAANQENNNEEELESLN